MEWFQKGEGIFFLKKKKTHVPRDLPPHFKYSVQSTMYEMHYNGATVSSSRTHNWLWVWRIGLIKGTKWGPLYGLA